MKKVYEVRYIKPDGMDFRGRSVNKTFKRFFCSTSKKAWEKIEAFWQYLPAYVTPQKPSKTYFNYCMGKNGSGSFGVSGKWIETPETFESIHAGAHYGVAINIIEVE